MGFGHKVSVSVNQFSDFHKIFLLVLLEFIRRIGLQTGNEQCLDKFIMCVGKVSFLDFVPELRL